MLKFLRARFEQQHEAYTVADACEEYKRRMATYDAKREMIRQRGPTWKCFDCQKLYPAEEFGASHTDSSEVYMHCVAPGHWRHCESCKKVRQANPHGSGVTLYCQGCNADRDSAFFNDTDSDYCINCLKVQSLELHRCYLCSKFVTSKSIVEPQEWVCFKCEPDVQVFECTSCEKGKPVRA